MRVLFAIAILAVLGAGCNKGGASKRSTATGTVTVAGKPVAVKDCTVKRVDDDSQIIFHLANDMTVTRGDDGVTIQKGSEPVATVECGSVEADSSGGSTGAHAWEKGKLKLDCGDLQMDVAFDCH